MRDIKTVAVIGGGVIGAGWAARCLAHGLDVIAWDPAPDWQQRLQASIENAWPALTRVGLHPGASLARLRCAQTLEQACAAADFVQEAAPERIGLKIALHAQMDAATASDVVIASSTSGLLPSEFQAQCDHPQRIIVGHPFNPVYLLPLVELCGGERTGEQALTDARRFYTDIGMHPLLVRKEVPGFLSDRLQEALWRELLHLVNDDVATTEELDVAVAYGPGLRWALWGSALIYHTAGGDGGMRHFLEHFEPSQFPWTRLDPPEVTPALIEKMASGCEAQAGGRSVKELEQLRDNCLIGIMQALRAYRVGAGEVLQRNEERRLAQGGVTAWQAGSDVPAPLALYHCAVRPEWVDYNGHMTESEYLTAFGWSSDALFRYVGIDEAYRAAGHSFFTAESHINYLREAQVGEQLDFTTQVLGLDAKRLHLFQRMFRNGELIATTEQMLLHVDTAAGRVQAMPGAVHTALTAVAGAHAAMERPAQAGRQIGIG